MITPDQATAISTTFSVLSTISWIFAQLPQQYQNFKTKNTAGFAPQFLILWMLGDTCSLLGCLLTHQLPFQTYLSCYFIFNDFVLVIQYFLYSSPSPIADGALVIDGETVPLLNGVEVVTSNGSGNGSVNRTGSGSTLATSGSIAKSLMAVSVLSNATATSALYIPSTTTTSTATTPSSTAFTSQQMGLILAWSCTVIYCSSRIPQLYKNYKRKSVEGISPFLFTFALAGNLTYTISILTSSGFVFSGDKPDFLIKELPYILGSCGTVLFDGFYFYQRWLYGVDEVKREYLVIQDDYCYEAEI